jgi:hypothetical protein
VPCAFGLMMDSSPWIGYFCAMVMLCRSWSWSCSLVCVFVDGKRRCVGLWVGGWAGGLGEEGCAGRLELWDYEQEVTRAFSKAYTQGGRHTFVKTPGGRVVMSVAQRFEKMRKTPEKSSGGRKKCS